MCVQNLNFIALLVPEIIGGIRKKWTVPGYAHASFSPEIFHGLLFRWTLLLFQPNLKFVALPVPEIIAIGVLGGVQTPNLGERKAVGGRGWYRSKERS